VTRKPTHDPDVLIRPARGPDAAALRQLAALDSKRPLEGEPLLAEMGGRIVAAHSPQTGASIADPFLPTAGVVSLLELRGRALGAPARVAPARARRRGLLARLGLARLA
jgi:hypothetical protein